MRKQYIQACAKLLQSGKSPDAVLSGLRDSLAKHGYEKMYPSVLQGLLKQFEVEDLKVQTSIMVASKEMFARNKTAIEAAIKDYAFSPESTVEEDGSLIDGFVLRDAVHTLDRSYKRSLLTLYRSFS